MTQPLLDTLTAIRERRTVKLPQLSDRAINDQTIQTLLEAANWAPNHGRNEPWRFAVFTGLGRRHLAQALAEAQALHKGIEFTPELLAEQQNKQDQAPVWILVAAKTPETSKLPEYEDDWATAAAVQNLLLAARAMHIASKWISNAACMHPHTLESLGFEKGCRPLGLLYLGYPVGNWPKGSREPLEGKVRWFRA